MSRSDGEIAARTAVAAVNRSRSAARKVCEARVRIRKHGGDDAYSWALFVDRRPVMTGMDASEARWRRKRKIDQLVEEMTS